MKPINSLPPFKRFCVTIGNLPSSYVDSMSYYECIMWLCKFLQEKVIPVVNENAEAVNELINWFNNLDVQDEIDNKLNEMVESGELQEIISEYLNSTAIFGFDSVADMIQSTNLINGSYAKTMGYYSKNDGGSATYKIRTITNDDVVDGGSIIAMEDDTLIAELITNDVVNPIMYGAKGDGTTDDTTALQNALLSGKKVLIDDNKTYLISEQITIDNGNSLYCENGIIKASADFYGDSMLLIGHNDDTPANVLTLKNQNIDMKIKLDLSGKANLIGVLTSRSYRNKYEIVVKNCSHIGVRTGYDSGDQSAENTFRISGINQRNSNFTTSLVLSANGSDDIFEEVTGSNFHRCVLNVGNCNFYDVVHSWITNDNSSIFTNSVLFETDNGRANCNNLYCDGLETAIKINHICDRFIVRDCLINYTPMGTNNTVYPLNAHTTDTQDKLSKGSIHFSSSVWFNIFIDSTYYDDTFAGLKIDGENLVWKSDNGYTSKMFQTDCVCIGATGITTGLTNRDSHLPSGYNGYHIVASCKRTAENRCVQEINSVNGDNYWKTCVVSQATNLGTNFASSKWYNMIPPTD